VYGPYVKYPYMSYLGAAYNASAELEYFITSFGRRHF